MTRGFRWKMCLRGMACLVASASLLAPARAEELKLAVGQRGNWDTSVSELGQQAGFFRKRGLELTLLYTAGGGETQQAVLSRSVDIGIAAGMLGALGAFSKGAPVRVISNETTGAADLYWYVPMASPIKTFKDLSGRTIAYSTTGSSTHGVVLMLQKQEGLDYRPTATGGLPSTFTQVMSGQIDIGWAAAPFGLDNLDTKIRLVFRGADAKAARDQTIRINMTHAAVLAQKKDAIERYMQAYRETLDWMCGSDDAVRAYAAFAGVSQATALRTRNEFFPRAALDPDTITGVNAVMADGVAFKFLAAPLTPAQLAQAIQLQPALH